jgi:hypothetical protein
MCAGLLFLLLGATGALWRLAPQDSVHHTTGPQVDPVQPPRRSRQALALVLPVLGAGIGAGLVLMPGAVRTEYSAQGAVLLLGPQQHGDKVNPYGASPYLDLASEIAQRLVMSPQTAADLRAGGFSDNYTAAAGIGSLMPWTDRTGRGSLIRLDVRADDPELAVNSRDAVVRELRERFAAAQLEAGSPPTELIAASVATTYDAPIRLRGNRKHALVAAGGLGFAGGATCRHLLGRLSRRRRQPVEAKPVVSQSL